MRLDDFRTLNADGGGLEFVEFAEGPTKIRQAGINSMSRSFQPRMFEIAGEGMSSSIISKIHTATTFYLAVKLSFLSRIKTSRHSEVKTWYNAQPIGVNKINSMMKDIIAGTTVKTSVKLHVVTKMKKANLERSTIAKVSGHRNLQSLNDYDEADEVEQQSLSWVISRRNDQGGETSATMSLSSTKISLMTSSESQH